MKKIMLFMLLLIGRGYNFAQDQEPAAPVKPPLYLEVGVTGYGANIAFGGFDLDLSLGFFRKNSHTLFFKTSLMLFVPSSIFQPQAPYVLLGVLWELQYALSLKNGFLFTLETGLGTGGEIFQVPVFTEDRGFRSQFSSSAYGLFSLGMRMGYDFSHKYRVPIKLGVFTGYRLQFPFNFTVKHFILYGLSLSYTFTLGGSK